MRRLAGGDTGALGELYDRHSRSLRRFLARATADAEDVDDLVHATFLAAGEIAARYDGRLCCRPWLIGIAAQLLRRRRRTFGRLFAFLSSLAARRPAASIHGRRCRRARDVERALLALSEPKRITLPDGRGRGDDLPGDRGGAQIPIGTVWTRLHAARRSCVARWRWDEP